MQLNLNHKANHLCLNNLRTKSDKLHAPASRIHQIQRLARGQSLSRSGTPEMPRPPWRCSGCRASIYRALLSNTALGPPRLRNNPHYPINPVAPGSASVRRARSNGRGLDKLRGGNDWPNGVGGNGSTKRDERKKKGKVAYVVFECRDFPSTAIITYFECPWKCSRPSRRTGFAHSRDDKWATTSESHWCRFQLHAMCWLSCQRRVGTRPRQCLSTGT